MIYYSMDSELFTVWAAQLCERFGFKSIEFEYTKPWAALTVTFNKPTKLLKSEVLSCEIKRHCHPDFPEQEKYMYLRMVVAFTEWLKCDYLGGVGIACLSELVEVERARREGRYHNSSTKPLLKTLPSLKGKTK